MVVQQKILDQRLSGSEELAKAAAIYTWQKGEIAWTINFSREIFEVQMTGERWLSGSKWRYDKIYQFKFLNGSVDISQRDEKDLISHQSEDKFYVSFLDAFYVAKRTLEREKRYSIESFEKKERELDIFRDKLNIKDVKTFYEL